MQIFRFPTKIKSCYGKLIFELCSIFMSDDNFNVWNTTVWFNFKKNESIISWTQIFYSLNLFESNSNFRHEKAIKQPVVYTLDELLTYVSSWSGYVTAQNRSPGVPLLDNLKERCVCVVVRVLCVWACVCGCLGVWML